MQTDSRVQAFGPARAIGAGERPATTAGSLHNANFCIETLWIGQTAVVTLPAEIDITNADQVREDLLSVLNQGAALLIADLSTTTFCDSAGVSALARIFRRADASRSEMRLVVSTLAVQRVLALTGLSHHPRTHPRQLAGYDLPPLG